MKWEAEIAKYDDDYWKTDDYEMEDAVGKEFKNLYDFDYDSDLYDKYTAAREAAKAE